MGLLKRRAYKDVDEALYLARAALSAVQQTANVITVPALGLAAQIVSGLIQQVQACTVVFFSLAM